MKTSSLRPPVVRTLPVRVDTFLVGRVRTGPAFFGLALAMVLSTAGCGRSASGDSDAASRGATKTSAVSPSAATHSTGSDGTTPAAATATAPSAATSEGAPSTAPSSSGVSATKETASAPAPGPLERRDESVSYSPSAPDALPVYRCPSVAAISPEAVSLDPAAAPWAGAPVAGEFYLCDAKTPAARKTTARMVWDDQALNVLFVCEDPNVWSHFTQDQEPLFKEEVVELFLDPSGEGRDYFEFEVSPRNKRFAAEIRNNGAIPPRFSPARRLDVKGMTTRVGVDGTVSDPGDRDRRWTVFVRIPFAYLGRPAPKAGEVWRGNLYRIDRDDPGGAPDEYSCWSPTHSARPNFHISRYFGKIEFVGAEK